jgi:YD repeat-containing protein
MFRSFDFDDPSGQLASTAGTEQYTYDAAGNRLSLRRRDGRTLTFTYDNLNRMTSKLIPDGCPPIQPPGTGCPPASATRDVYYRYDLLGRQTHAIFDSQSGADRVTNVYDGFGNIAYSVTAIGGLSRQVCSASSPCLYDAYNNRTQVRVEGQTVTYAYDARSRAWVPALEGAVLVSIELRRPRRIRVRPDLFHFRHLG